LIDNRYLGAKSSTTEARFSSPTVVFRWPLLSGAVAPNARIKAVLNAQTFGSIGDGVRGVTTRVIQLGAKPNF